MSADGALLGALFRHRRAVLFGCLAVTLVLGAVGALTLRLDNGADVWLPGGDPELEQYERFKARFGEDSHLALSSSPLDPTDEQVAAELLALVEDLRAIDGVSGVRAPLQGSSAADFELRDDLLGQALRGADDERLALLVEPRAGLTAGERLELIAAVEARAADSAARLGPFAVLGTDVVTRDIDRGSARSFGGLFPVVAAALSLVLFAFLRSVRMTITILVAAVAAAICTMGTLGLVGRSLNVLLVVIPAILAVLTVAGSMHLAARFLALPIGEGSPSQAERVALWKRAWSATVGPCALTTLTTMLGFASLAVSPLGPVRDLGLFTAIGAGWVFLFIFTLVPLALVHMEQVAPRPREVRSGQAFALSRVDPLVAALRRRRAWILAGGALFLSIGATGLTRLRIESHVLRFFSADHPTPAAYADFEETFFGLSWIDAWVEGPLEEVASAETVEALDRLRAFGLEQELIEGVLSPLDQLAGIGQLMPSGSRSLLLAPLFAHASGDPELGTHLWSDGGRVAMRMTFTAPTTSSNASHDTVRALRSELERIRPDLPAGVELRISGAAPLLTRGQVLLLQTQVRSFLLALAVISLVIFAVHRSLRLTLVSIVPNVLPILGTLGLMGWLDIPLDAGTATIAGIALGLVIDDTIHLMHRYAQTRGAPLGERVADMLVTVGWPVVVTSIAVAVGFGLFAVADFRPTRFFGVLIAVTSAFALLCALVLLPAVLLRSEGEDG